MSSVTLSVRVSPEIGARLERLATATARSKSFLAAEAIEEYLALQEWQVDAITEGVREVDAGVGRDFADVRAEWERRVADRAD